MFILTTLFNFILYHLHYNVSHNVLSNASQQVETSTSFYPYVSFMLADRSLCVLYSTLYILHSIAHLYVSVPIGVKPADSPPPPLYSLPHLHFIVPISAMSANRSPPQLHSIPQLHFIVPICVMTADRSPPQLHSIPYLHFIVPRPYMCNPSRQVATSTSFYTTSTLHCT